MKTASRKIVEAVRNWEQHKLSNAELVWIVAKIAAACERDETRQGAHNKAADREPPKQ